MRSPFWHSNREFWWSLMVAAVLVLILGALGSAFWATFR